jgi:uncharacterized 2Fe-2S/4Fe-4S cluster protein (DUF4445 family)
MRKNLHTKKSHSTKSVYTIKFLPFDVNVEVPTGISILDAAIKANIPIKTSCGGKGTCGECIVQIISGKSESKSTAALPEKLIKQGYVLACLTEITDDITILMPQFEQLSIRSLSESRFFEEHKNDVSGIFEINPPIRKIDISLPQPTIEDNYSDYKRLQRELEKKFGIKNLHCEYSVLKNLSLAIRVSNGEITVVLFKSNEFWTIIDIAPYSNTKKIYGIACDIGTTTVAVQLIDLVDGKILSTAASYNQQIKCGEDIISRINYANNPLRLEELHHLVITTINQLIEKTIKTSDISFSDIYYASVSGNTTMLHLFLNLEPRYIREEPYVSALNEVPFIPSHHLGLKMNNEGRIHLSPMVGSYVGGDITAGLLCTPILRNSEKISLFIDIGTNGELVIGNKDWLATCACSAGPAFEGSGIKCGMPAADGAIEDLMIKDNGDMEYQVIGDSKPKGLCGSGIIDLLAELFIHGYIDKLGKFNQQKAGDRLKKTETSFGFIIEKGENCFQGTDLIITENDIANLIRTKGAVFSAATLLLKNVGLNYDRIDAFYIAGGFGQHLNIENAIRIGLFPDIERSKFHYLGNSSLLGAYLILLSDKNRELVNEILSKMTYIELNTESNYMNEYTGSLFLPHTDINLFPSVRKIFKI